MVSAVEMPRALDRVPLGAANVVRYQATEPW